MSENVALLRVSYPNLQENGTISTNLGANMEESDVAIRRASIQYGNASEILQQKRRRCSAGILLAGIAFSALSFGAIKSFEKASEYGISPRTDTSLSYPTVEACYEDPTQRVIQLNDEWRTPNPGEESFVNECLALTQHVLQVSLNAELNNALVEPSVDEYQVAIDAINGLDETSSTRTVRVVDEQLTDVANDIENRRDIAFDNSYRTIFSTFGALVALTAISEMRKSRKRLKRAKGLVSGLSRYYPHSATESLSIINSRINTRYSTTRNQESSTATTTTDPKTGTTVRIELLPHGSQKKKTNEYSDYETLHQAGKALERATK